MNTENTSSGADQPVRPWRAKIITLLPEAFPGILGLSTTGRALAKGLWELETINLRDFGIGRHRAVDDNPFGGGAGMVLRADVLAAALRHASNNTSHSEEEWPVLCMSPRGIPVTQELVTGLSKGPGVTLVCGRFEGIDERFLERFPVREVSIGDFVLAGGEIAAQALIEATVRLIPLVLGNQASVLEESFSSGLLEYPQYTRPRNWEGIPVPDILLSGHHEEIAAWRLEESRKATIRRRPDLWERFGRRTGSNSEE